MRSGIYQSGPRNCRALPIDYSVDHRQQRIKATAAGELNLADIESYITSRVRDGVYDYDQVVDLARAELRARAQDVVDVVNRARVHLSERPFPLTAIVATPGTGTYGVVRQLSTLFGFDGASIHVCDSTEDARAWLDEMRTNSAGGGEPLADVP